MSKRSQAPSSSSGHISLEDGAPPFLPLEETMGPSSSSTKRHKFTHNDIDHSLREDRTGSTSPPSASSSNLRPTSSIQTTTDLTSKGKPTAQANSVGDCALSRLCQKRPCKLDLKKIILLAMLVMFMTIIYESFFVAPADRLIQPDFSDRFLNWVQTNPVVGLGAILLVIAGAVVSMVPIGTPLTVGCGYIYRGVYGWQLGLFVSTLVSMAGSTLGAVVCFLLGRYLMRDTVKRWVRNYPLFDAIDVAASENGLKIMAMLYLTPVLPLGLVSYMCGTTSMALFDFAAAKIASLPLYFIYTFIGASAHTFIKQGGGEAGSASAGDSSAGKASIGQSVSNEAKQLEENQFLIVSGLILSLVMMTLITRHIRKELMKILDQQKKAKMEEGDTAALLSASELSFGATGFEDDNDDKSIELGLTSRRKASTKMTAKLSVV